MTITTLGQVRVDNAKFRIDDGYFCKEAVFIQQRMTAIPHVRLGEVCSVFRKGIFEIKADSYTDAGVPFVRIGDLRRGLIDRTNIAFIRADVHRAQSNTALRFADIVLSKTAYPAAALISVPECNVSQDVIAVKIGRQWQDKILTGFIVAYLNGKYGIALLQRQFQGNVQLHLALPDGKKVPVPVFANKLQVAVHESMLGGNTALEESRISVATAEQALLRALGLEDWQPPEPLTYTRRASEVFAASRFDSDYFSPRVTDLLGRLGKGGRCLRDVAPVRQEKFKPGVSEEFDYIEISDVASDGTVCSSRLPCSEAPSRAQWVVRAGDVLTSTVRPIRRLSAVIAPEQDGFVCSSGFAVLNPTAVPAEVALAFLRLPPVCGLMDLHTSASLYPAISEADLLALPFPQVDGAICKRIVEAVQGSHAARRQAHALLERAKRAVEVAIEESKSAALKLLAEPVATADKGKYRGSRNSGEATDADWCSMTGSKRGGHGNDNSALGR